MFYPYIGESSYYYRNCKLFLSRTNILKYCDIFILKNFKIFTTSMINDIWYKTLVSFVMHDECVTTHFYEHVSELSDVIHFCLLCSPLSKLFLTGKNFTETWVAWVAITFNMCGRKVYSYLYCPKLYSEYLWLISPIINNSMHLLYSFNYNDSKPIY